MEVRPAITAAVEVATDKNRCRMCEAVTKEYLCPSFSSQKDAKLLGVLNKDGIIDILPRPLEIHDEFAKKCHENGFRPEEMYRFVGLCARSNCSNWHNNNCSVATRIAKVAMEEKLEKDLPVCGIRPSCRWFAQEQSNACRICRFIVTDTKNSCNSI